MKANERLIYFFEVQISTNKEAATAPPLNEVVEKLREAVATNDARFEHSKGTAIAEIVEILDDVPSNTVTLFIRCSDKNAADVYFANSVLRQSRVERKREGEGRAFGAHLTVSLAPKNVGGTAYSAALEKANGVSSTIVVRMIQGIFRRMYQADPNLFTCPDLNGARTREGHIKRIGFRPMIELAGLPSEQFIMDIENGEIKEIQLIEESEERQIGARPWLIENQKVLKLAVQANGRPIGRMWENLTGLFAEKAQEGISRARIKFKRPDGQVDTVDVDPETGGLLDQKYVKAKRISDLDPPMDECSDGVVPHFAAILRRELLENP
ncbi:hypothetical protein [Shinella sp.]|uniref:hypothetical protein n=1 Tax=Shinella sp. TaxID=1870904 RepID=UPI0040358FAB